MRRLSIAWVLALVSGLTAMAEPTAEWKLPEADGRKWVARVEHAVGRQGYWSVELQGNEITVRSTHAVAMVYIVLNGPIRALCPESPLDAQLVELEGNEVSVRSTHAVAMPYHAPNQSIRVLSPDSVLDARLVELEGNVIIVRSTHPVEMAYSAPDGPAGLFPNSPLAVRLPKLAGNEVSATYPAAMALATRQPAGLFPNSPMDDEPVPDGERTVRFVLRFAPKMSMDEYDRLEGVNAASDKEFERLAGEVGLPHKFYEFIGRTQEEKERVRAFRAAVAKLPRHALPHLYTPDFSIFLLHTLGGWSYPADEKVAAECKDVLNTLMRLFGMYSPAAAAGSRSVGQYLSEAERGEAAVNGKQ